MLSLKLLPALVLLIGVWITPSDSGATLIDFRTQTYTCPGACSNPDDEATAQLVVDGVTWTLTPTPAGEATLYWDTKDGFGVRHAYEKDEIEADEILWISFSEEVFLNDIYLTDLFTEKHLYRAEAVVMRRERIGVAAGKFDTLYVRIDIRRMRDGVPDEKAHPAAIWFSDDADRIPVRIDADTKIGRIRLELRSYTREGSPGEAGSE